MDRHLLAIEIIRVMKCKLFCYMIVYALEKISVVTLATPGPVSGSGSQLFG